MNTNHVYPVDDLVAHDLSEECVCGPDVEFVIGGKQVIHHSLDGRERKEGGAWRENQ
jgi:hypothetical protein